MPKRENSQEHPKIDGKGPRQAAKCRRRLIPLAGTGFVALALMAPCTSMRAQSSGTATPPTNSADPRIVETIKQVSPEHIQQTITKLVGFGNRSTISPQDEESVKAGKGVGAARDWIKSEFERYSKECGGCLEVKTDAFIEQPQDRIKAPTQITNVYAVLRGSDPAQASRIVLVTGHYDSRNSDTFNGTDPAPGANDDGSGTAVSLECARVLSKASAHTKFPATIIFLTVAGEEQGLNGSKHFAEMAKQQGWKIEAVLNNDIVGGDRNPRQDASVVRVFSEGLPNAATEAEIKRIRALGGESDSASRELARYIVEIGRTYDAGVKPLLIFRLDRFLRGGDHLSFNRAGFAAVRFTEFREDYNHQHQDVRTENGTDYGDLPKFVNFDYVADVAKLNAATLASLASAPAPPANVKMLTKNLENDTTLTWNPSDGASAYEVIWRSTSAPDWEHAQTVTTGTRATLPLSKDNEVFAVRALDAGGHRSLPVVPEPER